MARISDKHGLTNKYRQIDIGKRVVKRGRPRKKMLNGNTRRKGAVDYSVDVTESKVMVIILATIVGIVFCWFAPIFIPIFAGIIVIWCGDALLKKIWNLPSGKWSRTASPGWMFLTILEMVISFFIGIFILVDAVPVYVLVMDVVVYIILSVLILYRRNKKILMMKQNLN